MKEKYDIEVVRVPMDIEQILTQLSGELQTGTDGSIDMIWINGENFQSARSNDMLYGPFSDMLPNFKQYIDADRKSDSAHLKCSYGFRSGRRRFSITRTRDFIIARKTWQNTRYYQHDADHPSQCLTLSTG